MQQVKRRVFDFWIGPEQCGAASKDQLGGDYGLKGAARDNNMPKPSCSGVVGVVSDQSGHIIATTCCLFMICLRMISSKLLTFL